MITNIPSLKLEIAQELPFPYPATIAVSRSRARRLVALCESSEMTMRHGIVGSSGAAANGDASVKSASLSSNSAGNSKSNEVSPYILVIEMALLIYLGEYTHARHLWRRCRRVANTTSPTARGGEDWESKTEEYAQVEGESKKRDMVKHYENANNDDDILKNGEYAQLEILWNAARYCYLWSNGGIYSLGMSVSSPSATDRSQDSITDMQVEESTNRDVNLPFSTLALKALQTCQSSEMYPLSIYAKELIEVFRYKVNEELHRSFRRIKFDEFFLRMDIHENDGEVLEKYGWIFDASNASSNETADHGHHDTKKNVYIIHDPEWEPHYQDYDVDDASVDQCSDYNSSFVNHEDVMVRHLISNEDRIRKLTDVIMFMEQSKMNV